MKQRYTLKNTEHNNSVLLSANTKNMGSHRMFSANIINSSRFLRMPQESQNLYFHLGLRADDDGIVEAYPIMQMTGIKPDAYSILIARGFIKELNSDQIVFISDWHEHNTIRADRIVYSIHRPLLEKVLGSEFTTEKLVMAKPRADVEDNSRRLGGQSTDRRSQVKLSKDKVMETQGCIFPLLENNYEEPVISYDTEETSQEEEVKPKVKVYSEDFEVFWSKYPKTRKSGKTIPYDKWQKLTQEQRELVLADIDIRPTHHTQWIKQNGAFVPAPEVYLNSKREYWLQPVISEEERIPQVRSVR